MSAARRPVLAGAGLVLTMAMWGSMIPTITIMLRVWDPYSVSVLRFFLGTGVLWIALAAVERRWALDLDARHWKLGAMIAAFATFYTLGIAHSDLVSAALISALGPFITTILAWIIHRDAPPAGIWISIPLAVAGSILAAQGENVSGGLGFRGGEILLVFSQICWSIYSLVSQPWLQGSSQYRISATTMATATVFLVVIAGSAMAIGYVPPLRLDPDPEALAALLWLGVVATATGVFFWNIGVRELGAPVSSLYLNLIPVIAVLLSLALGARPTWLQLIGGVMVIAAVAQMQLRRLKAAPRPA